MLAASAGATGAAARDLLSGASHHAAATKEHSMKRRLSYFVASLALALAIGGWGVASRLSLTGLAGAGNAGTIAAGVAALDQYDYTAARKIFTALAQGGDAQAEIWLGRMDQEGLGSAANGADAVAWFSKAAQLGAPEAERRLGELYLRGDLVLQDVAQARQWLEQAAQHHDEMAAHDLGTIYATGLGVAKDPKQAYAWLSIAASQGDRTAATARDKLLVTLSSADAAQAQSLAQATLRSISAPQLAAKSPPPAPPAGTS
jgi:TPR repeat protein